MNEKKHIDRLFQEKFKDFEAIPGDEVWSKIRSKQESTKKRALIIPLWYRVGGIAALLAILFSIGLSINNNPEPYDNIEVVNTPEFEKLKAPNVLNNPEGIERITTPKASSNEQVVESTDDNNVQFNKSSNKSEKPRAKNDLETNIASQSSPQKTKNNPEDLDNLNNSSSKSSSAIAQAASLENKNLYPGKEKDNLNKDLNTKASLEETQTDKFDKTLAFVEKTQETNQDKEDEPLKKSLLEKIEEEEKLAEQPTSLTNEKLKRWQVSPNVAPVYYNTLSSGSSIDAQFSDNDKNGQINMSYGVQIAYQINEKLSIRSGVSRVDVGYGTEDVGFSPSAFGKNLENVAYNNNAQAIIVSDFTKPETNDFAVPGVSRDVSRQQQQGNLNQQIGYLEVPMEMKYALINKKVGISMIGGLSTLILQENQLSIASGDLESEIGTATNLNDLSFTGNLGIGIDYKLSEKFQINMEPMFKYQFNAIENNSENFRPFYLGVYTGVSFKF